MNSDTLVAFRDATMRKRGLEAQLKEVEAELEALEDAVRNQFADAGITSVALDTHTVYLARELRARPAGGDDALAAAAFKAIGEDWIVKETINRNTLSSWLRDHMDKQGNLRDVPLPVLDTLEITNIYRVRARARS